MTLPAVASDPAAQQNDQALDKRLLKVEGGLRPPVVTSLPASPADGQEVYYLADAANGVLWRLRYNAASTSPYKWEFVGGSDLIVESTTSQQLATANSWTSLGISITCPLAGDYQVEASAYMHQENTGLYDNWVNVFRNGVAGRSTRAIGQSQYSKSHAVIRSRSAYTGMSAGHALNLRGMTTSANGFISEYRTLLTRPVRVA